MRRLFGTDDSAWTDEANRIHSKTAFALEEIAKQFPDVDIRDMAHVFTLAAVHVGVHLAQSINVACTVPKSKRED